MKKIFHLLILIHVSLLACLQQAGVCLYAQQPTQEWVARYVRTPGTSDFLAPFFALDKNGNSIVAGTNKINDSINIVVIKYNASGGELWSKLYKYPGEGYFAPVGLTLDTLGNPYITSIYGQSVLTALNILTVKFDGSSGSVVWANKFIGSSGSSNPTDIKIDRQNNIYVVGDADSSLLCVKYDMNGDSLWVRKFHPPGDFAAGNACTIDDSLNIIITGSKSHCVSIPPPGACFDTLLTVKYNTNGVFRWAKTYFYPLNPINAFGIEVTYDQTGNIYIAGQAFRQSTSININHALKYDRDGNLLWVSIFDNGMSHNYLKNIVYNKLNNALFVVGGFSVNNMLAYYCTIRYNMISGDSIFVRNYGLSGYISGGNDLKVDTLGNCYVTGGSGPYNTTGDIVTIKYNLLGNQIWIISYNGSLNQSDVGRTIELDNYNNLLVSGTSQGDYVVVKYSQTTGIHISDNEIPSEFELFQNYPNPFNPFTKIKFSIPKTSFVQLRIFDLLGRQVELPLSRELIPSTYELSFDASKYSSGVYFYQLTADGSIIDTKKFIVNK